MKPQLPVTVVLVARFCLMLHLLPITMIHIKIALYAMRENLVEVVQARVPIVQLVPLIMISGKIFYNMITVEKIARCALPGNILLQVVTNARNVPLGSTLMMMAAMLVHMIRLVIVKTAPVANTLPLVLPLAKRLFPVKLVASREANPILIALQENIEISPDNLVQSPVEYARVGHTALQMAQHRVPLAPQANFYKMMQPLKVCMTPVPIV